MKRVVQIFDEKGKPAGGRVFIAPDEDSLNASMADLPQGRWVEVESEDLLVIPEAVPLD